jgi:hypothetical protein
MSVTETNTAQDSSLIIQNAEGLGAKPSRRRAGARLPVHGLIWASFGSILFMFFPFLFLPGLENF